MLLDPYVGYFPLATAIVAATAATWLYKYTTHLARIRSTLDLHAEFHSESFIKARVAADRFLSTYFRDHHVHSDAAPSTRVSLEKIYEMTNNPGSDGASDWISISRLLHFFERMIVLRNRNLLDRKSCDALLGRYLSYFQTRYFDKFSSDETVWKSLVQTLTSTPRQAAERSPLISDHGDPHRPHGDIEGVPDPVR